MLDPETIHRLEQLARRFRWGIIGGGRMPGRTAGRRLGSAGEFESYRPFAPGDDLRALDVKVFARLHRRLARVQREDSLLPITLLIDRSASMGGALRPRAVAGLALFFTLLARRLGDPIRIFTFGRGRAVPLRLPRSGTVHALLNGLIEHPPQGTSDFTAAFRSLPPDPSGRGVAIVISDAFGITEPERQLAPLLRVGLPFWLAPLEPGELQPTLLGRVRLEPKEREPRWVGTIDERVVARYRAQLQRYHAALGTLFEEWGGGFHVLPASDSVPRLLERIREHGRLLAC